LDKKQKRTNRTKKSAIGREKSRTMHENKSRKRTWAHRGVCKISQKSKGDWERKHAQIREEMTAGEAQMTHKGRSKTQAKEKKEYSKGEKLANGKKIKFTTNIKLNNAVVCKGDDVTWIQNRGK